jgi:hypothetical protein
MGRGIVVDNEEAPAKELTPDEKLDLILTRVESLTNALSKVARKFPLLGIKL